MTHIVSCMYLLLRINICFCSVELHISVIYTFLMTQKKLKQTTLSFKTVPAPAPAQVDDDVELVEVMEVVTKKQPLKRAAHTKQRTGETVSNTYCCMDILIYDLIVKYTCMTAIY